RALYVTEQKIAIAIASELPVKADLATHCGNVEEKIAHRRPQIAAEAQLVFAKRQADRVIPLKLIGELPLRQKIGRAQTCRRGGRRNAAPTNGNAGEAAVKERVVGDALEAEFRERVLTKGVLHAARIVASPIQTEFVNESGAERRVHS